MCLKRQGDGMATSRKIINTGLSLLFAAALFLFILSFSISLPIYFRPFYYAHIGALNLAETSGSTAAEIKEAYNAVLDYLTLPGREFSAGVLAFSRDGATHFADCKVLFNLNAGVLFGSGLCLLVLGILRKADKIGYFIFGRHSASFYSAVAAIILPIVIGGLVAVNFDRAFVIFHSIFFPKKENWLFNPSADEIINVLPQEFFMNCAILVGASILIFSASLILAEAIRLKKRKSSVNT